MLRVGKHGWYVGKWENIRDATEQWLLILWKKVWWNNPTLREDFDWSLPYSILPELKTF